MPPIPWSEVIAFALVGTFAGSFFYFAMTARPVAAGERDRMRVFFAAPRTNALLLALAILGANGLLHDLLAWTGWFALDGRYAFTGVSAGIYVGALLSMWRRARMLGVLPVARRAEG